RIEILDRADDHDVVGPVAHHLELELLPSFDRLLDQHLVAGRRSQAPGDLGAVVAGIARDRSARAAKRARGANYQRQSQAAADSLRVVLRVHDRRGRNFQPDVQHRLFEQVAVLGLFYRVQLRADQLDLEAFEHARFGQLDRKVERGLAAYRRQQGVGTFALDYFGNHAGGHRLDIGPVGQIRIGHDRRRIGVDQDDLQTFLAQRLQSLSARVVELAGLADHDR